MKFIRRLRPASMSLLLFLLIHTLIFSGCSSKELSRSKAESLIINSAEFKYPVVIELKRANENEPLFSEMKSDSETMEESKAANLSGYLQDDPRLAVVNYLELINIEQTMTKEEPKVGFQVPPSRYFVTKFRANDKGKAFWKEMNLELTDEAIPIAGKTFISIERITQQSAADNQAIVDYSYKLVPNSIGKMFDPNGSEFKSLPLELQKQILGQIGMPPRNRTENWNNPEERKAKAFFQRYDDDWKLEKIVSF